MATWTPTEVALVTAAVGGLITAISSSVVSMVGLYKLNTKIDGMLVDRDKAKVEEGGAKEKLIGAERAATLAEGQRQGRESQNSTGDSLAAQDAPVPVVDDVAGSAAVKSVAALESLASLAKKSEEQIVDPKAGRSLRDRT